MKETTFLLQLKDPGESCYYYSISLLCSLSIILTSYVSRGRANQRAIERLKDMLVLVRRRAVMALEDRK